MAVDGISCQLELDLSNPYVIAPRPLFFFFPRLVPPDPFQLFPLSRFRILRSRREAPTDTLLAVFGSTVEVYTRAVTIRFRVFIQIPVFIVRWEKRDTSTDFFHLPTFLTNSIVNCLSILEIIYIYVSVYYVCPFYHL